MDELDPRKLRELSESLNDLTGTVKYTSQAVQSMLDPESTKKLKQSNEERAAIEQAESNRQAAETSKAQSLEAQQNKMFQDELRWRGYKTEETGKLVKTSVELTASQRQSLEALDKRIAKERELAEVTKDPVKSFRNISGSVNSLQGIMGQFQEKMFEMTGKSVPMAAGLTALTATVAGVAKAALSMADSLYKGERGAKVGAKAVKELSDTVTKAAYGISAALMFIPGLGLAAKLAGAAIGLFAIATEGSTKLIEMGAEYNDKVYDSFNKLSESGLTTAKGMSGVSNTMEKLGVTSAELEKMNALLSSNSKDLALFGGTAAGGLEKFTEIAGKIAHPASELNKKLMLLGISADEQREHTLKYMALQQRMGMMQGKTQADLVKGSVAYMEELDRIAAITGIGRKEQEEAQKQVMAIEELRAAMYQAEKNGDTKRQAELEQAMKYSTRLMAEGRKKEAAGVAKYYAAGKNVVDAESAAAAQSSRGAIEAIGSGKKGEDVYQAGIESAKEAAKRVAGTKAIGGDVSSQVGDFNATLDAIKRSEKAQEEMKRLGLSPEKYAEKLQKEKTDKPDPQLQKNVEAIQIQQKAGLVLDQAAKKMDGAGLAMAASVKAFNDAVNLFNKTSGGGVAQGAAVEKAKAVDTAALNKQQAAMDANTKAKTDPNATKAQKEAAQKAEDDANKESMLAMAKKREALLKEQNDLREINKKQRASGKEVYKTMEDARKAGAAPAAAPAAPAAAPASPAPSTSSATSGSEGEAAAESSGGKSAGEDKSKAAPTSAASPVSLKSTKSDLLIANEPVSADKPLSKAQLSMIELGIGQGNKFPEMVMQKFNSQMFGATPGATGSNDKVNVNKALEGGIFSGPGASGGSSSVMSTIDILNSLKNSFDQVERKTIASELPELAQFNSTNVASNTPQKETSVLLLEELTGMMEQKLSDIISAISDNNDIKEEILLYSRS
jgi:hypothetical protein